MTTIADLVVALRGDASGLTSSMNVGIKAIENLEMVASRASARLEQLSKAYALPQSAISLRQSEALMMEAIVRNKAVIEKQAFNERLARMEMESEAAWRMGQQKISASMKEYRVRVRLEEQIFDSTHNQREIDLRNARNYFARLQTQHKGNAKMLKLIAQAHALEQARIQAGPAGPMGGYGGGSSSNVMTSRMLHGVTMAAGMQGGVAGMGSMALMLPALATATLAPLMAIGVAYKSAKDQAQQLKVVQQQHTDMVREAAEWMERYNAMATTAAGGQLQSRISQLQNQVREQRKGFEQGEEQTKGWRSLVTAAGVAADMLIGGGGIGDTSFGRGMKKRVEMIKMAEGELKTREAQEKIENRIEDSRRRMSIILASEGAKIQAMVEGPWKRRLELTRRQAEEEKRLEEYYGDRLRKARQDYSIEGEQKRADIYYERDLARKHLVKRQGYQEEVLKRQEQKEIMGLEFSAQEASIKLKTKGYAQELALLRLKHEKEIEEYRYAGKVRNDLLLRRQTDEKKLLEKNRVEGIDDIKRAMKGQIRIAEGATQISIEREERERLWKIQVKNNEELKEMMSLFDEMKDAKLDRLFFDMMEGLDLQLDAVLGQMTEAEVWAEQMRMKDDLTPKQINQAQERMEQIKSAKFAQQELDTLKTKAEIFREYRDDLLDAQRIHEGLTDDRMAQLLENKMKTLMGQPQTGKFVQMSSRWEAIQGAILGPKEDIPKITLKEIREMKVEIEGLKRIVETGVKIRG